MSDKAAIQQAILKMAGMDGYDKLFIEDMEVNSVDEDSRTCICSSINGVASFNNMEVRLMASIDDGLLRLPTVESTVIVAYSTHTLPFILMYSSIDKILCIVGDQSYTLIDGSTVLNDGSFGGMAKVPELVGRLNKIENGLNALTNNYNTHLHPVTAVGSPTGVTTAPDTTQLTPTQRSDIENTAVTHGNKAATV